MMKRNFIYLSLFIMVAMVSSCSSTKKMTKSVTVGDLTEREYVDKIIDNSNKFDVIWAKSVFTLIFDKKDPISVSGTMRIKRGEVVMLSAVPLLGIEVARVEITPSGVLVIDRMKKRYVKVSYSELNNYLKKSFDYNSLEALFINSIFIPGANGLSTHSSDRYKISKDADNVTIHVDSSKELNYSFITSSSSGRLIESDICLKGTPYTMRWKYGNFRPLQNSEFPSVMNVNLDGVKNKISLEIELTKLTNNSDWTYTTDIPKKYEKVGLDDILKILAK